MSLPAPAVLPRDLMSVTANQAKLLGQAGVTVSARAPHGGPGRQMFVAPAWAVAIMHVCDEAGDGWSSMVAILAWVKGHGETNTLSRVPGIVCGEDKQLLWELMVDWARPARELAVHNLTGRKLGDPDAR